MFLKDPYSFSGNDIPEKDIFFTENDPEREYRKIVNYSFLYTGITFMISFFLAGSIARTLPADAENKLLYFLKDFIAGSIFFLPVAAAAVITRKRENKRYEACNKNFLPLLPSPVPQRKKLLLLFTGTFLCGILLQIPVLFLSAVQKSIFQLLGIELPPQEKVAMIAKLLENGNNFLPLLFLTIPPLFFAPLAEELFFRLILFDKLNLYMKKEYSFWGTNILFALLHGNIAAFLPLLLVGCICQKVYLKTSSLLAAILLHTGFNLSTILLMSISHAVK